MASGSRSVPLLPANLRGYGAAHQALRRRWASVVARGGVMCARCGREIVPGSPWDLGHVDGSGKGEYSGPEHRRCNRRAGARRGNRLRARRGLRVVERPASADWW